LIKPRIKRLAGQFGQVAVADFIGIFRKPHPELPGRVIIEKSHIEMRVMAPIVGRIFWVGRNRRIKVKHPIERSPDARIIGPVKGQARPSAADLQRGRGAAEIKRQIAQQIPDRRVIDARVSWPKRPWLWFGHIELA